MRKYVEIHVSFDSNYCFKTCYSEAASGPCGDGTGKTFVLNKWLIITLEKYSDKWPRRSSMCEICTQWKLDKGGRRNTRVEACSAKSFQASSGNERMGEDGLSWFLRRQVNFFIWYFFTVLFRLQIEHLWEIDWFGGGYDMPLADYFAGTDSGSINSLK